MIWRIRLVGTDSSMSPSPSSLKTNVMWGRERSPWSYSVHEGVGRRVPLACAVQALRIHTAGLRDGAGINSESVRGAVLAAVGGDPDDAQRHATESDFEVLVVVAVLGSGPSAAPATVDRCGGDQPHPQTRWFGGGTCRPTRRVRPRLSRTSLSLRNPIRALLLGCWTGQSRSGGCLRPRLRRSESCGAPSRGVETLESS
jgi:hypothetical protein